MKPKKPVLKKKAKRTTNLLSFQLQTLEQVLKNAKCTTDKECKEAVWFWLSNHAMYSYYLNESRKKSADQIFSEVFMQVSAYCMNKGFCTTRPLTLPKFKQTWNKAIRQFEKEAKMPAYLGEF